MKLLSKVRLHLLPVFALKELKQSSAQFSKIKSFETTVEQAIINKQLNSNVNLCGHRLSTLDKHSILCIGKCSETNTNTNVFQISGEKLEQVTELPHLEGNQSASTAVNVNGTIYVVGGFRRELGERLIHKFTPGLSDSWKIAGSFPNYVDGFGACCLLDKIYILGGKFNDHSQGHCFCFNPVFGESLDLPCMVQERQFFACTAFGSCIFICGGDNNGCYLRSAEIYDPEFMKWTKLPNMYERRVGHQAIASKGKVFVVGVGDTFMWGLKFNCEVYDSVSNVFTILRDISAINSVGNSLFKAVLIDEKIFIFFFVEHKNYHKFTPVLDTKSGKLSTVRNCLLSNITNYYSCIKVPGF